jgi:small subunit ribosomal protein S3
MGQKINPQSLRLGVTKNWPVRWFVMGKNGALSGLKAYRSFLEEDEAIRKVIKEKIAQGGIASLEIERTSTAIKITIRAARPGFVIGRGGKGIEELTKALENALRGLRKDRAKKYALSVNVEELKRSDVSAAYIAQQIGWDIEKRIPFRQIMRKQLEQLSQNKDVKGAKIQMSGRLDGAEIARREWKSTGALPLQTLRADIDYARGTAFTTYGTVGIKVWVYKGEIFEEKETATAKPQGRQNGHNRR